MTQGEGKSDLVTSKEKGSQTWLRPRTNLVSQPWHTGSPASIWRGALSLTPGRTELNPLGRCQLSFYSGANNPLHQGLVNLTL